MKSQQPPPERQLVWAALGWTLLFLVLCYLFLKRFQLPVWP